MPTGDDAEIEREAEALATRLFEPPFSPLGLTYIREALRATAARARREALEEAATLAEATRDGDGYSNDFDCVEDCMAARLRALAQESR